MEESPKRTRILTIAPCASCLSKHLQLPKLPKRGEKEIRKSCFYDWGNLVPDDDELRIK